jgi:SAM-dependent methyltransferase
MVNKSGQPHQGEKVGRPLSAEEIMPELSRLDPAGRFSGRADLYARHRPTYTAAAVDLVLDRCGLKPGDLLVDVGSGTGISSRLFAARGLRVVGVEPNDQMRQKAEAEPAAATVEYRPGKAEATGLADGCAAAVLAAQAFHWFDPKAALAEFHRILRLGGWVALLGYERDESEAATAAVGAVIRSGPDAATIEGQRARACEALLHSPLFTHAERVLLHQRQELDEEGLLGRALSASYAPKEPAALSRFTEDLRRVFAEHERDGTIVLHYETSVYLARRQSDKDPA